MGSLFAKPKVVQQDPAADAATAAAQAAASANIDMARRKKRQQGASLLAQGAQGVTGPVSALRAGAYGKETLGG